MNNTKIRWFGILWVGIVLLSGCGRSRTKKLLLNKRWAVTDVTPPSGTFNIEQRNRAAELKNGFYKGAWFEFLPDSVFIASFGGKVDTAKYAIRAGGDAVALYPRFGHNIYEQISIVKLEDHQLQFNTEVADFRMTLHLKATPLK